MKKITFIISFILMFGVTSVCSEVTAATSFQTPTKVQSQTVSPVKIVNNPSAYLNKTVCFNAEFVAFSSLGLDYKPAFKDSTKYIGILINRDDVNQKVIPLSEMKIFLLREEAEKYAELDQGDKINITGKVFSTALGDPWLEVTNFKVISQKNKNQE